MMADAVRRSRVEGRGEGERRRLIIRYSVSLFSTVITTTA
jgi:hypothetical protein